MLIPEQNSVSKSLILSTVSFVAHVPSGCTDSQIEICLLYNSTFENIKHLSLVSQEEIKAAVAVLKLGRGSGSVLTSHKTTVVGSATSCPEGW